MRILNWEFGKRTAPNQSDDTVRFTFMGEFLRADLESFDTIHNMQEEVVKHISRDIYPDIKERMLEDENFKKIINEIRLKVSKQFIEEK
jgi:hypothetical protein